MGKLDMEKLKGQQDLTDEDFEAIRDAAYEEEDKDGKDQEEKEPKDLEEGKEADTKEPSGEDESVEIEGEEKSEEDLLNTPEEELNDDEKSKRQELLDKRAQEEQKLIETPDDKLEDEQKKEKQELIKQKEAKEAEQLESSAKDYAEQNKISIEDAKKEIKQINDIKSRYDGDPDKIAKSNLYLQRMASKAKNDLKQLEQQSKIVKMTPEAVDKMVQENKFIIDGKAYTQKDLVNYGRQNKEWEDIVDTMDDEAVYKLVKKDLAKRWNAQSEAKQGKIKETAAKKRIEAIKDLANYDNKFFERTKQLIEGVDDRYIASDKFDVKNLLNSVKGDMYDEDIKAAYERGRKEGESQAKIINKKPPIGEGKGKKPLKGGLKVKLSEAQKSEALSMFESADVPDNEKFKMYVNVYPEKFGIKKKKKEE